MESEQKQKVLDDLYTLRAGIAFMAAEKEKIDNLNSEAKQKKFETYKENFSAVIPFSEDEANAYFSDATLSDRIKRDAYFKADIPSGEIETDEDYQSFLQKTNEFIKWNEYELREKKKERTFKLFLLILGFIPFVVAGLAVWGFIHWRNVDSIFMAIVSIIVGGIAIFFGVILLSIYKEDLKLIQVIQEIKDLKTDVRSAVLDRDNADKVREICIEIENERENAVNPISQRVNELCSFLVDQYKTIIDKRDWKYLDLVIFYFQTGRADTIKEALQQVDIKVQNDAIINEIKAATNTVCQTVQNGINAMSDRLDVIISQNDIMISQNNIMINQGEIQNALLTQISKNTEQMMVEVQVVTG